MDFSKKPMKSSPDNENNSNNTEQGRLRIWLRESSPSLNPLKTMFGPSGFTEESGSQFCYWQTLKWLLLGSQVCN